MSLKLLAVNFFTVLSLSGFAQQKAAVVHDKSGHKGLHIIWDPESRRRVSSPALKARYSGYGRVVELSDGSLLAVYEADGSIVSVKSSDRGNSWSAPIIIAGKNNGSNMSVPDVLLLKDNTILSFYNARPYQISSSRKFGILLKRSVDSGLTWTDEQRLYDAGHEFENGCWEPAAIQLPGGEIQLFFANEGPYVHSDEQNISMLRSLDNGKSWTKEPVVVSFRQGKRDGMPVPLLLNKGNDIVVAIEDNFVNTFKPYIVRNTTQQNWTAPVLAESPDRSYALSDSINDEIYAGAPYVRQLSSGETILSYQGTEGRRNEMKYADMKVLIGNHEARDFKHKSAPFQIPEDKSCLWNSLCILKDDTIIAVTTTNAYSHTAEVWMIKGKLIRDTNY